MTSFLSSVANQSPISYCMTTLLVSSALVFPGRLLAYNILTHLKIPTKTDYLVCDIVLESAEFGNMLSKKIFPQ